jgi:hypothetical protein
MITDQGDGTSQSIPPVFIDRVGKNGSSFLKIR